MPGFIKVARKSEIGDQTAKCVEIEGRRIALFNLAGQFYAIADTCTHQGGPLSEGILDGEDIECPWHGARFNVTSGAVCTPPAGADVVRYNVRVMGDDIEVEV